MSDSPQQHNIPHTPPVKKGNKGMLIGGAVGCVVVAVIVFIAVLIAIGIWWYFSNETKTWEAEEIENVESDVPVVEIADGVEYDPATKIFTSPGNAVMEMKRVAGGSFYMGADGILSIDAKSNEYPVHRVTLSGFYIASTEVPQWLWTAVMNYNPSKNIGSDYPVEQVSRHDVRSFISRLNDITGESFTLPTEAQWEYAARDGVENARYRYAGSDDADVVAWHKGNSYGSTHRVASKRPNGLGIYDMTGNVFEWCRDSKHDYDSYASTDPCHTGGGYASGRGGSFKFEPKYCRTSFRAATPESYTSDDLGFRLAID